MSVPYVLTHFIITFLVKHSNATFNINSVISWLSVVLEGTGISRGKHQPATNH